MSGDWHVRVNQAGTYSTVYSFNTSANTSTEIWIQAAGLRAGTANIGIKGKIGVSLSDQSFSGTRIANISTVTQTAILTFAIANGTVGPSSKTPTDSITFNLVVNRVTYNISGYNETGFLLDLP